MTDAKVYNVPLGTAEINELHERLSLAIAASDVTHGLARSFRAALRELTLFRNHAASRATQVDGLLSIAHPRVQIGGGAHTIEGFYNIDIMPPADLVWDVREGIPLADESVGFLFSEHFLEHIDYPRSVKQFVSEVYRVLVPGGQVVTGVPDAEMVLSGYEDGDETLRGELTERWYGRRDCLGDFNTYLDLVNYVFRDQDDSDKYAPHLWAYDWYKLESLFTEAGFSGVESWSFDERIANPERQWGTLYVVATK